ncbi:MAG: methionine synthase [Phycisphaerales bacterium]|nr:methionine synthase [Phycisphaerales bacterium]
MPKSFLAQLDRRVMLFDGAMGTSIHACADCTPANYLGRENCTDILVRSRPDMIQRIHESFLAVGADVVETDTFGTNQLVAADFDQEMVSWVYDLNVRAAQIARAACDRYASATQPRFVAGSMGPGTKLISLGQASWASMVDSYREQARGLIDGGADCFMIETCQDLLQIKCAITACLEALELAKRSVRDLPILVSVTMETTGTMLLGSDIAAVVNALKPFPIASLGLNCATGPVEMAPHIAYISQQWDRPFSVVPNAGLPVLIDGRTDYPLKPADFTIAMRRFVEEYGANIIGGCCGTTPAHIAALRAAVPVAQQPLAHARAVAEPACSSLYTQTEFRQDNSFLIVAERTNANGSRKFKTLLDAEDWDGLASMAKEEVRDGSHVLDVCVDFVGRDGVRDMSHTVARLIRQVNAPLMIDSTQADVIEAGLQHAPGRCIVNSINLEDGEARLNQICPLLKKYGAACVALTIDEDPVAGMAKTAVRKLEIAQRIHDLYTRKWGLDESDLFWDPLTFTIATGNDDDRRLGLETLEGIRLISERFPRCSIILGLSNISFGLKPSARAVLNSAYLHEARARGLTAAILHPSRILPESRIPPEQWQAAQWLIFDRRGADRPDGQPEKFDPLLHFISLFPDGVSAVALAPMAELPIEERLQRHIVDGEEKALEESINAALAIYPPLTIINDYLLAGMKTVGDLFGSGRMQLPFVLQSASIMKKAVALLQPHMERVGVSAKPKATIVLATVAGDVHDIGKNLVDIILSNNGYKVHNIGIKQSLAQILEAWRTTGADAVGMSGLLVKSVTVMEENLREMNRQGINVPVMLGGAALTRHYAEGHLRRLYQGEMYYGRDAFEGLAVCEAMSQGTLAEINQQIEARLAKRTASEARVKANALRAKEAGGGGESAATATVSIASGSAFDPAFPDTACAPRGATVGGAIDRANPIPDPPFWGSRLTERLDLDMIYPFINRTALFRGQWGFRRGDLGDVEYARFLSDEVEPILERLKRECRLEKILRPAVVWGYFPCNTQGDDLVVFDSEDHDRERERFTFPRQKSGRMISICDFFRPIESGVRDVLTLTCVTMGSEASHRAKALFERSAYTEYLYLHGMGVECAEALAEMWHKRIRAELGYSHEDDPKVERLFQQHYRGSRYSFGYPACPEMADQEKLFRLLQPERIGCTLTENYQIEPEQSTSAIVVHHPQAKYFSA